MIKFSKTKSKILYFRALFTKVWAKMDFPQKIGLRHLLTFIVH